LSASSSAPSRPPRPQRQPQSPPAVSSWQVDLNYRQPSAAGLPDRLPSSRQALRAMPVAGPRPRSWILAGFGIQAGSTPAAEPRRWREAEPSWKQWPCRGLRPCREVALVLHRGPGSQRHRGQRVAPPPGQFPPRHWDSRRGDSQCWSWNSQDRLLRGPPRCRHRRHPTSRSEVAAFQTGSVDRVGSDPAGRDQGGRPSTRGSRPEVPRRRSSPPARPAAARH
jgi:hypothetical protein